MGASIPRLSPWWSGCPDLNRGPLRPERSALTKLRYSPRRVTSRLDESNRRSGPRSKLERTFVLFGGLVTLDDDLADAAALQGLDTKGPVALGVGVSRVGDLSGQVQDVPGDRDVLALRDHEAEFLLHLV